MSGVAATGFTAIQYNLPL